MTSAYNQRQPLTTRLYIPDRYFSCNLPAMEDVAAAVQLLRQERKRLGWSTRQVAEKIVSFSADIGDPTTLTQQAVSKFENGRGKSVPAWIDYFTTMIRLREQPTAYVEKYLFAQRYANELRRHFDKGQDSSSLAPLSVPSIDLPSEPALAQMFEGLLESVDRDLPLDALARELAQLLPTALSQLRGRLIEQPPGTPAPVAAAEARPTAAGVPQR